MYSEKENILKNWETYLNPTQSEIENLLFNNFSENFVEGKNKMEDTLINPKQSWILAMADPDMGDLCWHYGFYIFNSKELIPPKSILNFIYNRLKNLKRGTRLHWQMPHFLNHGNVFEKIENFLDNHPWDNTEKESLNHLEMTRDMSRFVREQTKIEQEKKNC